MKKHTTERNVTALTSSAALGALAFLTVGTSSAFAATLSYRADVDGTPSAVWAAIGPFCAIKDWLPQVGACIEDGKSPPTRTVVTEDGKAAFVETQTARDDAKYSYSYNFRATPLPVRQYVSTIKVVANGKDTSTVIWSSTYTPEPGKEKDASDGLLAIYEAGLTSIKARLAK
ncbi:ketosteroid isomerase-like protein [Bradyrhizobium algeriense]|uniref:Ketosteroid isomerase-like protein n=1 Tax=Bradyrhizobium algeriense TaxID=634784 RepID=A0ABU8B5J7_9BRAD